MFYCYVLGSQKPVGVTWALAKIWMSEFAATMRVIPRPRSMECHGYLSVAKVFAAAPKQHDRSATTKLGEVGMNSTS
jgi:hypothetical protein